MSEMRCVASAAYSSFLKKKKWVEARENRFPVRDFGDFAEILIPKCKDRSGHSLMQGGPMEAMIHCSDMYGEDDLEYRMPARNARSRCDIYRRKRKYTRKAKEGNIS
jgi:hypothetical protein